MPGEIDSMRDYVRAHRVATTYRPQTLARVAERATAGEDLLFAVREFLDDLTWSETDQQRAALIEERPATLPDPRGNAFLGALAEHVAAVHGLDRPQWSVEPERFLDRWWFPAEEPAFAPLAIVESPAAFRRRAIFISASLLTRV